MTYYQTAPLGVTTVDCHKQVRSWRLLRSLLELLIPTCNCTFVEERDENKEQSSYLHKYYHPSKALSTSPNTITGTLFGYRRGKVHFCLQTGSKSTIPILLLELAVPTKILAKEMQGGILRIALKCNTTFGNGNGIAMNSSSLLSMPVWSMFCNGRKVGFATKRRPTKTDMEMLRLMGSVVVGAGIIQGKDLNQVDELMYLRANFERVRGSTNSESFHLIDPEGCIGQELSIFFDRSH